MKKNFLDKAIGFFSPETALKRAAQRDRLRRYEAAAKGRRTEGWHATGSSVNQEIMRDGKRLRERARDLEQNNPYAKKALRTVKLNVVGTGIRPAILGTGRKVETMKKSWDAWADKTDCDFEGSLNFYGLQALIMYNVALSGEVLVLRRRSAEMDVPLQLQVVEPEYLDTSRDTDKTPSGGYIQQGIEFDASGRRKGYHIFKRHPSEAMTVESIFVDKADVIHIYLKERPGQQRGVPFMHAAMLRMKDFDDYEDAQLIRQKIASCFAAFVTDTGEQAVSVGDEDEDDFGRLEPGVIERLPPGKSITFASPPSAEGYGDYTRTTLQGVSAGVGTSYEALTNDYSNVNFSSGRMGWLEFQRLVEELQELLMIPLFCDKVWEWFREAVALRKGSSFLDVNATWTSPRREMIDPVKETNAIVTQVKGGLQSWSEAVRRQGYDPEAVAAEIAKDQQLFDKLGLKLSTDHRNELLKYLSLIHI